MEDQAYIGRQPVIDVKQHIIGYELFLKHADATVPLNAYFKAYAGMLMSSIDGMDKNWLLGDKLVFIRVNAAMLHNEFLELMPPQRTVLSIMPELVADAAVITRCHYLRKLGFKIALDNPQLIAPVPAVLPAADYLVIDTKLIAAADVAKTLATLHLSSLTMVAENIETEQQFADYLQAGFVLFAGHHFAQAEACSTQVINASFDSVLNLLNMVSQDVDSQEIEAGFKRDAALTFKLLRYINAVGFGLSCEIQSIQHALTILGRKQLYRWLTLLMVTAGENTTPPALMKTAISRGRLTELLGAGYFQKHDLDNLFVVGVFSLLDAILKMPMAQVLEKIQLPEAISSALLSRQGIYAPFLQLSIACEGANSACIKEYAELLQLDAAKVNQCNIAALAWVENLGL
jgi:EAL and modified HD-GYP domain-containing signal transduction protein